MKKALQMKGVSGEQADAILEKIEQNPDLVETLKALEANKEVKELFEKIQKEIAEQVKNGTPEVYATVNVMSKYKAQIAKHREALAPLIELMHK